MFALSAIAADAPKAADKAPEAKKEHKKADATKSAPAKKEPAKADAKAATPAAK